MRVHVCVRVCVWLCVYLVVLGQGEYVFYRVRAREWVRVHECVWGEKSVRMCARVGGECVSARVCACVGEGS